MVTLGGASGTAVSDSGDTSGPAGSGSAGSAGPAGSGSVAADEAPLRRLRADWSMMTPRAASMPNSILT